MEHVRDPIPADLLGNIGHTIETWIDSVVLVRRHANGLVHLHIKYLDLAVATASRATPSDYKRAPTDGAFLDPGLGRVDFEGLLAELLVTFAGCCRQGRPGAHARSLPQD